FFPLVLDDGAGFDTWKREGLGAQLQPTNFHHRLLDDVLFAEFHDSAVRFDGACGDVFDLDAIDVRDVDLAVLIAPALGKDLDARVVVEDEIVVAAIGDANLPKDRLSVGIRFNYRALEREVGRIDGPPLLATAGRCTRPVRAGCSHHEDD